MKTYFLPSHNLTKVQDIAEIPANCRRLSFDRAQGADVVIAQKPIFWLQIDDLAGQGSLMTWPVP